jgi:hypothetical protein
MPVADAPDFQLTISLSAVATADNPDWQITAVAPGGGSIGGGGGLMAVHQYAPSPSVTLIESGSGAAIDSTNLTISFTTNATGAGSTSVIVTLSADEQVQALFQSWWVLVDHTTPATVYGHLAQTSFGTSDSEWRTITVPILVTGLTPSTAYQMDWANCNTGGSCSLFVGGHTGFSPSGTQGGPALMQVAPGLV